VMAAFVFDDADQIRNGRVRFGKTVKRRDPDVIWTVTKFLDQQRNCWLSIGTDEGDGSC